ncbi:MAG TPA: SIS domain-containing protein, partial [Acidobacteriota bacterium]|nr:SIS domain-containing protein [Acidobacteriota bacterium]
SFEAIQSVLNHFPSYRHLLITCNPEGELIDTFAGVEGFQALALHPATCDQGLAMTSSFTSMVLAAQLLTLSDREEVVAHTATISHAAESFLLEVPGLVHRIAELNPQRVCLLGAGALFGAASEGALKILELTDGRIPTLAETYLGVRHGPLSFLDRSTALVCLVSNVESSRHYERELIAEVKEKGLAATTVAIGYPLDSQIISSVDEWIEIDAAQGSVISDMFRPPLDVILPQLLALTLSLRAGLDPDNPSPRGAINRVAEGVTIYQERQ